jgi:hypothetical protein
MGKSIEDRAEVINTSSSKVTLQVEEKYQVLPNHFILLHIVQQSGNVGLMSYICFLSFIFIVLQVKLCITGDWDGSVGVATRCELDDPGIKSWWGRDFPHLPRPALAPTQPPMQWVPGPSWG